MYNLWWSSTCNDKFVYYIFYKFHCIRFYAILSYCLITIYMYFLFYLIFPLPVSGAIWSCGVDFPLLPSRRIFRSLSRWAFGVLVLTPHRPGITSQWVCIWKQIALIIVSCWRFPCGRCCLSRLLWGLRAVRAMAAWPIPLLFRRRIVTIAYPPARRLSE